MIMYIKFILNNLNQLLLDQCYKKKTAHVIQCPIGEDQSNHPNKSSKLFMTTLTDSSSSDSDPDEQSDTIVDEVE